MLQQVPPRQHNALTCGLNQEKKPGNEDSLAKEQMPQISLSQLEFPESTFETAKSAKDWLARASAAVGNEVTFSATYIDHEGQ